MTRTLLIFAAISAGCSGRTSPDARPEPLRVAAASDLQAVMPRLAERFKAETEIEVVATFGASGQLAQQIKQGAPFDVFLAANRKFVADLAGDRAIDPVSVRDYAVGSLVLVVYDAVAEKVNGIDDLRDPAIKRIAIANPGIAPYGAAAQQALTRSGLWDALESSRVQSESVRQALQFVQTGNAEAAFVGSSIASGTKGIKVVSIPQDKYDPMWQALGVSTLSKRPEAARAFCKFLLEGEGKRLLVEAGFRVPSDFQ